MKTTSRCGYRSAYGCPIEESADETWVKAFNANASAYFERIYEAASKVDHAGLMEHTT